jgi:uncharacterized phage-like protein YoqJ
MSARLLGALRMSELKLCFTAHRVFGDSYAPTLESARVAGALEKVVRRFGSEGYSFITGGALGGDSVAASEVLKQGYPLHLYLPFLSMGSNWQSRLDRLKLESHKKGAVEVRYIEVEFSRKAYLARDLAMVENSRICCALYDGREGGGTHWTLSHCKGLMRPLLLYHTKEDAWYSNCDLETVVVRGDLARIKVP